MLTKSCPEISIEFPGQIEVTESDETKGVASKVEKLLATDQGLVSAPQTAR